MAIATRDRRSKFQPGTDRALRRSMQASLLQSVLFAALVGGCAGSGQFTYASTATVPDLVVISPGVQVIADLDEPIFYSGNYYWRNEGGFWYRSRSHTQGWARAEVAPVQILAIERPSAYVHFHGEARAHVSGDRQAPASRRDDKDDRHDNRDDKHHDRKDHDDKRD